MRVIGTINKRIDVGVTKDEKIYIMSSSNCIQFDEYEMNALLSVLSILNSITVDDAVEWFYKHRIALFEPTPPPAEIRII